MPFLLCCVQHTPSCSGRRWNDVCTKGPRFKGPVISPDLSCLFCAREQHSLMRLYQQMKNECQHISLVLRAGGDVTVLATPYGSLFGRWTLGRRRRLLQAWRRRFALRRRKVSEKARKKGTDRIGLRRHHSRSHSISSRNRGGSAGVLTHEGMRAET